MQNLHIRVIACTEKATDKATEKATQKATEKAPSPDSGQYETRRRGAPLSFMGV